MTDKPFTLLALSGRDAARETLDAFADGGRILEFTLPYAPPYEDFEWVGHEEEEWFEIAAMYLHDHRHLWNYVFLVRERDAGDCAALFFTLRAFLVGEMEEDRTFADREELAEYLAGHFPVEKNAAERLAAILMRPNARMFRSYPRLNALTEELARGGRITESRVLEAMRDPASVLHLIAGREAELDYRHERKPVRVERRDYGKEAV